MGDNLSFKKVSNSFQFSPNWKELYIKILIFNYCFFSKTPPRFRRTTDFFFHHLTSKDKGQKSFLDYKPTTAHLLTYSLIVWRSQKPATTQTSVIRCLLTVVLKEQIRLREGIREVGQMRKHLFSPVT